jgi:hypothetical protein
MSRQEALAILELSHNAKEEEIKAAYRRQARKWHPDLCKESGADEKMRQINNAFDVLMGRQIIRRQPIRPQPVYSVYVHFGSSSYNTAGTGSTYGFYS